MVSRIDIGPDGGPYVAINENSNDLELQDINGNVIAVWDETEGQWDLNNNSLTNINAIDASSANLGSVNTEELDNVFHASQFGGADGGAKIQNALDKADSEPGENGVIIGPVGPDSPSSAPETDVWEVTQHIDPEGYNNTHLIGRGYPMLFLADGAEDDILRTAMDDSGPVTSNVHIEGLRFHGNRANNTTNGRWSDTATIKGLCGIRGVNCENWTVEDCVFLNTARFGLQWKLSDHMTVRNCWASGHWDDGFTTSNEFYQSQELTDNVFKRVFAFNNDDQGIEIEDGSQDVTIRDSWFENNGNYGGTVKTHSASEFTNDEMPCNHVSFVDCTFKNNNAGGLSIGGDSLNGNEPFDYSVRECTFEGNYNGPSLHFGSISDVTVADCQFDLDGAFAAIIPIGGANLSNIKIKDATIRVVDTAAATYGIHFRNAASVDGLTISADIDASGTDIGIDILGSNGSIHDVTISDDTIVENSNGVGLRIEDRGNDVSDIRVSGTYKNNGQDSGLAATQRGGVRLWGNNSGAGLTDITVTNVRAYDDQATKTQQYGVLPRTDYSIFEANNLRGNAGDGYASGYLPAGVSISNGRGYNSGDPNSTGAWNGEEARAERHNVVVEDTTNNNLYMAVNGSYVAIDTQ